MILQSKWKIRGDSRRSSIKECGDNVKFLSGDGRIREERLEGNLTQTKSVWRYLPKPTSL